MERKKEKEMGEGSDGDEGGGWLEKKKWLYLIFNFFWSYLFFLFSFKFLGQT